MEDQEVGQDLPVSAIKHGDGKFSFTKVFNYLQYNRYPDGVSKADKNSLRKRAAYFTIKTRISTTWEEVGYHILKYYRKNS